MSEGGKWTPGKIFLLILGILAGLGIVCCGGFWLVAGDKIKSVISLGQDTAEFVVRLQKDYGKTAVFQPVQNDRLEWILAVGVEGDLTPERVTEIQDGVWKTFAEVFAADGFLPVGHVAVGHPAAKGGKQRGHVVGWSKNMVAVEELVRRTGVAAPPVAKIIPEEMSGGPDGVYVEDTGEAPTEDDGGGGK